MILPAQLLELVRSGGGASVDANDYIPDALLEVARAMNPKVTLVIRGAEYLLPAKRLEIARASGGTVIFEFKRG